MAVTAAGTVNCLFRIGRHHYARFPRTAEYEASLLAETHWLGKIVNRLAIATPVVVHLGKPDETYSLHWAIYRWIEGENFDPETDGRDPANAAMLAAAVAELQAIPTTGELLSRRCDKPHSKDWTIEPAINFVSNDYDAEKLRTLWQFFYGLPGFDGATVWTHGDLIPPNLLSTGDGLTAVIDWGSLGEGDPAIDYIPAFTLFRGAAQHCFRESLAICEADWQRARAYAFRQALRIIPYYHESHPAFTQMAYATLDETLGDGF